MFASCTACCHSDGGEITVVKQQNALQESEMRMPGAVQLTDGLPLLPEEVTDPQEPEREPAGSPPRSVAHGESPRISDRNRCSSVQSESRRSAQSECRRSRGDSLMSGVSVNTVASNWTQEPMDHEFVVTLRSPVGQGLGLSLCWKDGQTLLVRQVKEGPVYEWNSQNERLLEDTLIAGDRIIRVNEAQGDSRSMMDAIRQSSEQMLVIQRLLEFRVPVEIPDGSYHGLVMDGSSGQVTIRCVGKGYIADLNETLQQDRTDVEIRQGDRIVAIYSERPVGETTVRTRVRKAQNIVELLERTSGGNLEFRIRRPPVNGDGGDL